MASLLTTQWLDACVLVPTEDCTIIARLAQRAAAEGHAVSDLAGLRKYALTTHIDEAEASLVQSLKEKSRAIDAAAAAAAEEDAARAAKVAADDELAAAEQKAHEAARRVAAAKAARATKAAAARRAAAAKEEAARRLALRAHVHRWARVVQIRRGVHAINAAAYPLMLARQLRRWLNNYTAMRASLTKCNRAASRLRRSGRRGAFAVRAAIAPALARWRRYTSLRTPYWQARALKARVRGAWKVWRRQRRVRAAIHQSRLAHELRWAVCRAWGRWRIHAYYMRSYGRA